MTHLGALSHSAEPQLVRFGTPAGDVHIEYGFERAVLAAGAEPYGWMRRRAEIRLRFAAPAARTVVLDLDPVEHGAPVPVRVLLNGHKVGRMTLGGKRERHAIDLPVDRQLAGGNVLGFVFAEGGPPRAARLFGLAVGAPSPLLAAIAAAGEPFSVWADGRDVVQAGPSRLVWAVRRPAEARLRFTTGSRHGKGATFRVEADTGAGFRELWRGAAGASATLALPGREGEPLALALHVDSSSQELSHGVWRDLAVLGAPAAIVAADPRRLAELRQGLAGANVLVLVLDAAGAAHFGCYGHARPTTPAIDRLAREGVRFERAYTSAVFTRSSMASFWTSQPPDEHHGSVSYDEPLPASVPTLAEMVSETGTLSAAFVGNGMAGKAFGLDRGFREFRKVSHDAPLFRASLHAWLGKRKGQRFLAYVHYREPHFPYDPPPPFATAFGPDAPLPPQAKRNAAWMDAVNQRARLPSPEELAHLHRLYDGNLALADREIGLLRTELERLGLWDRTLVVVTADHGEALFEHGFIGHNEQLYEESVHVPLVMKLPAASGHAGRRVTGVVQLVDVAPTLAEVLGVPAARTGPTFRGQSLLPAIAGAPTRDEALSRTVGSSPRYAWIAGRHKYTFDTRDGAAELYDLVDDAEERHDIAGSRPVVAELMRQRLFGALLALPGRSGAGAAPWQVPAAEREELRALGYVQ